MAYTAIDKATAHHNTKLWGGNTSTQNITSVGHQADLIWIKNRTTATYEHHLMDVLQGFGTGSTNTPNITSNNTSAAYSRNIFSSTGITADAYELEDYSDTNATGQNFVGWSWKAGGTGSANTDGDINSTVSVNTTAGFSIVKWTGNTTANQGIGHGLGVVPKMIILKNLGANEHWAVWHAGMSASKQMYLNLTNAEEASLFGSSAHTSSLFYVGNNVMVNGSGNEMIAYCFTDVQGFSKFGKFTGNGADDGPFINLGFKPRFFLTTNTVDASNWTLFDSARDPYNEMIADITPNTSNAEDTNTTYNDVDFYSNGVKIREGNGDLNGSGKNIIYMAFGQTMVGTNNIPATAR